METNKFFTLQTDSRQRFIQVPEQFMNKKSKYFKMKALTKLIYGILAKRNKLSIDNGWVDEENRIYFKFNQKELSEIIGVTPKTLRTHLTELEDFGLLFRKRLGLKQSDNLYLLQIDYEDFTNKSDSNISVNNSDDNNKNSVKSQSYQLMGKNYPSRRVKITHQEGKNLPTNNIYYNNIYNNDIYNTTTIEKSENKDTKKTESKKSSSNKVKINLDLKNITKTNIKKLKLNQEQIDLLEEYVLNSACDDIDGFSYFIAKSIKNGEITRDSLKSKSNKINKQVSSNNDVTLFRETREKQLESYNDAIEDDFNNLTL